MPSAQFMLFTADLEGSNKDLKFTVLLEVSDYMAALTEDVFKSLKPEQQNNLKRLSELADKEKQAYEKADGLFERGSYLENGAITICEHWDDFTVINAFKPPEKQHPIYREIMEVKGQIKQTLEESLRLDLGHLGLIQRQCKNYQVNIQV
jgi:hypothetical protein